MQLINLFQIHIAMKIHCMSDLEASSKESLTLDSLSEGSFDQDLSRKRIILLIKLKPSD